MPEQGIMPPNQPQTLRALSLGSIIAGLLGGVFY